MAIAGVSPVDGQLILAGITSAVAAEQFWVASWARERRLPGGRARAPPWWRC